MPGRPFLRGRGPKTAGGPELAEERYYVVRMGGAPVRNASAPFTLPTKAVASDLEASQLSEAGTFTREARGDVRPRVDHARALDVGAPPRGDVLGEGGNDGAELAMLL